MQKWCKEMSNRQTPCRCVTLFVGYFNVSVIQSFNKKTIIVFTKIMTWRVALNKVNVGKRRRGKHFLEKSYIGRGGVNK